MKFNINKLFFFLFLFFLYIGIHRIIIPDNVTVHYILNQKSLQVLFSNTNQSLILRDMQETGFIIKTYYHKYLLISNDGSFKSFVVKTSPQIYKKYKNSIGLSIARTSGQKESEDFITYNRLPPLANYVGKSFSGRWYKSSSNKVWRFYRPFRKLQHHLGVPAQWLDESFYDQIVKSINLNKDFFGINDEFKAGSPYFQSNYRKFFKRKKVDNISLSTLIKNYFKRNYLR